MTMPERSGVAFGYLLTALSAVLYVLLIVFVVIPLSRWIDTFLVVTWMCGPAIVGSLLYARMEARNRFDTDMPLS